MNKFQILIVEDDPPIRNLIATTLKTHDYKYLLAKNGEEAIMQASTYNPDVVFLDLGLPDIDGVDIIKKIREWSVMPIIVISARSEDEDKIEALDAGADDYLTKPFSVEELLARLRVMQRRIALLQADNEMMENSLYVNGWLKIDYAAGCAYKNDEELKLTPIEYKLLCILAKNTGKVLTHKYITQNIWGSAWDSNIASLRVFMATLRKKLDDENESVSLIQTHVGIGYRMIKAEVSQQNQE
ncbi:MAG: response regulator transcription factor [Lachnospiraceae bacterium]|nr:response regulator transcription factor [Lachnospiraceae bacterium]